MAHAYGPPLNHGHPSVSMSTQPSQHPRPRMHSASRSYSYNIPATSVNVMPGHAPPPYARMSATSDPYAAAYSHPHPHPMAFGGIHGPSGVPPRMAKTPGPYGNSAYGGIGVAYAGMGAGVPVAGPLPGWTPPAQYHAPQPSVPPAPQGYGYFQWPSTESVDEIPEDEREHDVYDGDADEKKGRKSEDAHGVKRSQSVGKKRSGGGLFESLRRKVAGPDVHLHTLLLHARPVPLTWDVRNAPASASRGANSSPAPGAPLGLVLSAHERAQYATAPPRSHMRITCDLMPWSIDVVAPGARGGAGDGSGSGSDSNQQQYITLGHLLDTVHTFLHRRVRRSEWLIANERMQEKVVRAFAWRCYNSPGPRGIEERQGPKRVDWLLKRTVFRGLSRTHGGGEGEEEWELHLGQH